MGVAVDLFVCERKIRSASPGLSTPADGTSIVLCGGYHAVNRRDLRNHTWLGQLSPPGMDPAAVPNRYRAERFC